MKLNFTLLFCVFYYFLNVSMGLNVVVWNQGSNSVVIGEYDISFNTNATKATPRLTIDNFVYDTESGYQTSSYNYVTRQLTFMASSNGDVSFITVDCVQWRVVSTHSVETGMKWVGLQYDQTSNANNLLAVGISNANMAVCRFNPTQGTFTVIYKLKGTLQGTAFIKNTQELYIFISQPTNGLQIYIFNSKDTLERSYPAPLVNYPLYPAQYLSGPYIPTYIPTYGSILSLVNFKSNNRGDTTLFSYFASISPGENKISITNLMQLSLSDKVTIVADQNGLQYLYSIYNDGGYSLMVYDLSINDMVKQQYLETPILAAF